MFLLQKLQVYTINHVEREQNSFNLTHYLPLEGSQMCMSYEQWSTRGLSNLHVM